jgi:hypothetical protein
MHVVMQVLIKAVDMEKGPVLDILGGFAVSV